MEEKFLALQGGIRPWWDIGENKIVKVATLYLPQGCPDWGEKKGVRNDLCTFCSLPYAASNYREAFFGSTKQLAQSDHLDLFSQNFKDIAPPDANIHTLMVFNAGSFLADIANAPETQDSITRQVADHPTIKRFVIESRAELVTDSALKRLTDILDPFKKKLTIRIGVETQNDDLRIKVLRKGHSRKQLHKASELMKKYNVDSGGYVLINPAPANDIRKIINLQATDDEVMEWVKNEAHETLEWILGSGPDQLGMSEAYFCSTNVGPGTPLTKSWDNGDFRPASLWMVLQVLRKALKSFSGRVHLLPFKDEPALLAVPSNHIPKGIAQDLSNASGCDLEFHNMLNRYRETLDPNVLIPPTCNCMP